MQIYTFFSKQQKKYYSAPSESSVNHTFFHSFEAHLFLSNSYFIAVLRGKPKYNLRTVGMAEGNGWIAVGDPRLVESDTEFPDVSPQTWCTGGYGIHRVVGKKTLEEVDAAGGEDADTATNVGVGVGGLRDV